MINKINGSTPSAVGFKQNQNPTGKTTLSNYKDNFINSSKSMLPTNIALALVFSLIGARKDWSKLGKTLGSNLLTFLSFSCVVSAVDSAFKTNSDKNKYK